MCNGSVREGLVPRRAMSRIRHQSAALTVRGQLAGQAATAGLAEVARRLPRLPAGGERGAQAAEYALLGGVSAAACGALVKVLKDNSSIFRSLIEAVLGVLSRTVGGWF